MQSTPRAQRGFTLLEVLIAIVILSVGLLGVAGMQASGMRTNKAAYNRTVATAMAMDMIDRIRANPRAIDEYNNFDTENGIPTKQACINNATGCTPAELAMHDKYEWGQPLDSEDKKILPDGRGHINIQNDQVTITILWQETHFRDVERPRVIGAPINCEDDIACLRMEFRL